MADHVQILRRIGACENPEAQPDWTGPAIPPCSEPAAFLCETCGRLLCGGHAGGHWHPAGDTGAVAAHFQEEASKAQANADAAAKNTTAMQAQLDAAHAECRLLAQIRELVANKQAA